METVHLVIDLHSRFHSSPADLIIRGPHEYKRARSDIYACVEGRKGNLTVVVRHAALRNWFDDLKASPVVRYEMYSPKSDVERRYDITLPLDITDADAVELDLDGLAASYRQANHGGEQRTPYHATAEPVNADLDAHRLPNHPSLPLPTDDSDAWIVGHRLGTVWLHDEPPVGQLAAVATSLLSAPLDNVWLLRQARFRLAQWRSRDLSPLIEIWRYLERDPRPHAEALVAYDALRLYRRENRRDWLGPLWPGIDALEVETLEMVAGQFHDVALPRAIQTRLEENVRVFLNDKTGSGARFEQLLAYATGKLRNEGRALALALIDRPSELTAVVFEQLGTIVWHDDRAYLERLRRQLPVPAPSLIPEAWAAAQVEDVCDWVRVSYLPWYESIRYRGDVVDADPICASFAGWLDRSYPDLVVRLRETILGVRDRIEAIVEAGRPVIWIVVDALGVEWAETLSRLCADHNLAITAQAMHLTMLPTVTHVAKPALLCGQPAVLRQDLGGSTSMTEYRRLVADVLWGGRLAAIGAEWESRSLVDVVSSVEAPVWIYLVNRLDKDIVHERMPFGDRVTRVRSVCAELVGTVRAAQETALIRYGQRPAVVFSADHGFTTPAADAVPIVVDVGMVQGRCVTLREGESSLGPGWLALMPPERFGLATAYALAYGNRFPGDRSPLIATHGGANPEEVFVPYIECDGIAPQVVAPTVRVRGPIKAAVDQQEVDVSISNTNPIDLTGIVVDAGVLDEPLRVDVLAARQEVSVTGRVVGGPYASGDLTVTAIVRYAMAGEEPRSETALFALTVERPLQRATQEKLAFEEMFDE